MLRLKRALLRTNLPEKDLLPLLLPAFDSCGAIEMIQVSQSSCKGFLLPLRKAILAANDSCESYQVPEGSVVAFDDYLKDELISFEYYL